jgi:hypothetical protein
MQGNRNPTNMDPASVETPMLHLGRRSGGVGAPCHLSMLRVC